VLGSGLVTQRSFSTTTKLSMFCCLLKGNTTETGFMFDSKSDKVLAPRGQVADTESGGLKEQITILVTTRADGKVM